jgi:hypothetical protein
LISRKLRESSGENYHHQRMQPTLRLNPKVSAFFCYSNFFSPLCLWLEFTFVYVAAIILPEQSVAAEKSGLATSKKGLTLKELLPQTSHHNAKVRKDALYGIKDLFKNHPEELQSHKYAIIQKLRERISDDDKLVRDVFYQLFDIDIFPLCKEDNQGLMVSLLMPYIFSAMAHSAIDVRLMAFKFFHLVVEFYPPTFSLDAEKVSTLFFWIMTETVTFPTSACSISVYTY